jgi:hypothetical protein
VARQWREARGGVAVEGDQTCDGGGGRPEALRRRPPSRRPEAARRWREARSATEDMRAPAVEGGQVL